MKIFKIEIQVLILTICIAAVVVVSGNLAYQSLHQIVDTIHKEARPDLKLLIIKDITTDLNEVENSIRMYSVTGQTSFLRSYRQLGDSIQRELSILSEKATPGSEEIGHIDSISILTNKKLAILDQIRTLHRSKTDTHKTFSDLYSKIDTAIINPDTIRFKPEPKKSFFKRLFGKRDTTTKEPVIIDKAKDKETIKKEIAGVEEQITSQNKQIQSKETRLIRQNILVTQLLNKHIIALENIEQEHLLFKASEVDLLAAQTYRKLKFFTIAAMLLLIIVLVLFFRNLQKNKIYQRFLNKAKNEAENLAKAKEMFVATVSHEMRTPINAIYGLTTQMLQKGEHKERLDDIKVVHKSAEHLIALVNDTLDFSKIESQKMKIEQIDFRLAEILSEIKILHQDQAKKKGIDLVISNLIEEDMVLKGDPIRLKQILINLITNALKFTSFGKVTLTANRYKTSEEKFILHIEVADTGVGISAEELPLIFEEFVQLGSDLKQKQRGAGLGLSIVKKLVLLHEGTINVQSTPGKGTTFIVEIPYLKGKSENLSGRSEPIPQIPSWFGSLRFLIVDDEEFNLYMIRKLLQSWKISFTEAANGQEAVKLAERNRYDLILMDIRMPVMDGYEAAETILKSMPDTKIVALTATSNSSELERIKESGMHSFLSKPFEEKDFINTILDLVPEKLNEDEIEAANNWPGFDLNELERMAGGDLSFLREMIQIFIRSSEDAIEKFHFNLDKNDWVAIADTAHKLAAPAKHMKATMLYQQLKQLETQAEHLPIDELKAIVQEIETEILKINVLLKQRLE